jgi:hypothetical protein
VADPPAPTFSPIGTLNPAVIGGPSVPLGIDHRARKLTASVLGPRAWPGSDWLIPVPWANVTWTRFVLSDRAMPTFMIVLPVPDPLGKSIRLLRSNTADPARSGTPRLTVVPFGFPDEWSADPCASAKDGTTAARASAVASPHAATPTAASQTRASGRRAVRVWRRKYDIKAITPQSDTRSRPLWSAVKPDYRPVRLGITGSLGLSRPCVVSPGMRVHLKGWCPAGNRNVT